MIWKAIKKISWREFINEACVHIFALSWAIARTELHNDHQANFRKHTQLPNFPPSTAITRCKELCLWKTEYINKQPLPEVRTFSFAFVHAFFFCHMLNHFQCDHFTFFQHWITIELKEGISWLMVFYVLLPLSMASGINALDLSIQTLLWNPNIKRFHTSNMWLPF